MKLLDVKRFAVFMGGGLLAFLYLLFFSPSTSPLFNFEGYDSAVFKTIGLAILRGKTLYVDIFDNKGPILYLINALGETIWPGRMGLFLLQVLGMTSTLIFAYSTSRLFAGPKFSLLAVVLALITAIPTIQEGNQCEEWATYAFMPSFYLALRWILVDGSNQTFRHVISHALVMGLLFGYAFFIRPNDGVAVGGGMALGLFVWMVCARQWRMALIYAISWAFGLLVLASPIVLYFASKGALYDFYYGFWELNVIYSAPQNLLGSLMTPSKMGLALLLTTLICMLYSDKRRRFSLWIVVPVAILMLLMLGAKMAGHYYIIMLPLFLLYYAILSGISKEFRIMALAVMLFSVQTISVQSFPQMMAKTIVSKIRAMRTISQDEHEQVLEAAATMFALIPPNERDSVWNYNLGCMENYGQIGIFYHNGIVPCNRILFDFQRNLDIPMTNYQYLLEQDPLPLWVVVMANGTDDLTADPHFQDCYTLVFSNFENHTLYRRHTSTSSPTPCPPETPKCTFNAGTVLSPG